jgi:hypothetical protein
MKYTKEPWAIRQSIKGPYIVAGTSLGYDAAIAKVLKLHGSGRLLEREQEQQGNAVLMASAPELLGVCKQLLRLVDELMPGLKYLAIEDYAIVNDAPLAAHRIIRKIENGA